MLTYNFHPLFVHFPIALLFVYSVVKVLPFKKWFPNGAWKHIERALLLVGVLGAFIALGTGDTAEQVFRPNRALVEMHSTFAAMATWIYVLLLLGELSQVIRAEYGIKIRSGIILEICAFFEKIFCEKTFSKILAVAGCVAISVTGLLGGAMVYGTTADPFAGFVIRLLGISM
jgi:uncharacterized membrane protein